MEHLFGTWGGARTTLRDHGVNVIVDVTTEFAGNVSGGVKRGATFANQLGLEVDLDLQRIAGIRGLATHAVVVNRSGSSDSTLFGDNLLPVQEIYGAGGDTALHFVYAYAEETLADGRLDMAVGRMPLANDFAASPLYCNFMNNAQCGNPKALTSDVRFSSYPDAVWGGRIRVRPVLQTYVQTGVYEVNQDLYQYDNSRSGFTFDTSRDSGVDIPVEAAWEPVFGAAKLPGHYKVGFAYDSSSYAGFTTLPAAQAPRRNHGETQVWVLVDQMLLRNRDGDDSGLIVLADYVHNDPDNAVYADQYTVGLLDRGFWTARPHDGVGLLFSYNTVSGRLGKLQGFDQEFGLPVANGATGIQTHEMILEANYDIHAVRGVDVQPEFQYVFRPNAQSNIHDAAVFGFKAHVTF